MNEEEVVETFTKAVPSHFLFKIQAFSLLSKNSIEKYESNEFEAGGYKWNLSLYPDGNKAENGDGHISLYLVLEDSNSLPAGSELNVHFRLFLFDQIREEYLIREDMEGKASRIYEMKKVPGFPRFISLAKFEDLSNGYLVNDTCVFGAEVIVLNVSVTHTWRIDDFSKIKEESLYSEMFKAGDHNWDVSIYPKGDSTDSDNCVSLFLNLADRFENSGLQVCVGYKLRVRDQINGNHIEKSKERHCFYHHGYSKHSVGWSKFIVLDEMNDKEKGFLVNDTCIIEAEIQILEIASKKRSTKRKHNFKD